MAQFVDLTPVGMQTPEGVQRVTEAQSAWQNQLADLGSRIISLVSLRLDDGATITIDGEDAEDLRHAIRGALDAQDAFLRAVAGRA